jgi:lipopolysaccharide heptosyltransferase II
MVPEIDEVIVFEAPWMKASKPSESSRGDLEMIEKLRHGRYDAAIIFTVFTQNPLPAAYLAYLANIPLRLAHLRENPYGLLTDWVKETDLDVRQGIRHEVQRQLDLVAGAGFTTPDEHLSLCVPPDARMAVQQKLGQLGLDLQRPWLALHPGSTAPSRRYPPENFARAADILARQHGYQIVLSGGPDDCDSVQIIKERMLAPWISTVGRLGFDEFAALVQLAPLLLCNNSGPAHIAAALGTPVVDLYALTNPQHTPWQVPCRVLSHEVPCRYCFRSICPQEHHDCLRLVHPQAIADAVIELSIEARRQPLEGGLAV